MVRDVNIGIKRTVQLLLSASLIVSIVASSWAIANVEANGTSTTTGWQTAEPVEDESGYADSPQIAMNDDGDAIAVWRVSYSIYAARYWSSNVTWGTDKLLETSGNGANEPQIAMNDDGDAIVVWYENNGSSIDIYAVRYWSSNDTWGTVKLLETAPSASIIPQIAMNDEGDAIAVYHLYDGIYDDVYAIRYWSSNDTWGTVKELESADDGAFYPQIAMDNDGNAIAVWYQTNLTYFGIYAAQYWSSNDTWGDPVLLETTNKYAYDPQIAMNDDGDAIVVWYQTDDTIYSIYAAKYWSSNDTWSDAVLLEDKSDDTNEPQIAMNDEGDAIAVWHQGNGTCSNIYAAKYWSSNDTWSDPVLLGAASSYAICPQIAMNDDGDAMAVWYHYYSGSPNHVYAAKYWSSNDTWSDAVLLDASGYALYPQIAMNDDGDAIAVWYQKDGSYTSIYAAAYVAPTKLTVTTPSDGSTVTTSTVRVNGTTEAGASVIINGYVVYVDDDGNFSAVVALAEGENTITVRATDGTWGLSTSASIVVTYDNEMQDEIDDLKARLTAAEAAISATNTWLSSVNDTLAKCYDAQNATADDVDDMIEDVIAMKAALIELRASLNDTNGSLISTDANVTALTGDLDDMIAHLSTIESSLQGEIDAANVRINEIFDALNDTEDWLASVNDTLNDCYDAQNATADEVTGMLENITSMKAALIELRASLNDTNGSLTSTDANVTALAEDLDNVIAELTSAETTLTSVQSSLESMQGDVDEVQSDTLPLILGALGLIFGLAAFVFVIVQSRKPKAK